MSRKTPANPAASIRQRLLDRSRLSGVGFQDMLVRYGTERLLFRLSRSPYADRFLLKGARLFTVWDGAPLAGVFGDLASLKFEPHDGLRFAPAAIQIAETRAWTWSRPAFAAPPWRR